MSTATFADHLKAVPDLPVIKADTGDLALLCKLCFDAIAKAREGGAPVAYRWGGVPSRIERGDDGRLRVQVLTLDRARNLLATVAGWEKSGKKDTVVVARVPMDAARQVLAAPDPPLKILRRLSEHPYMAPDGTIVTEPGFRDGVYLADRLPGVEVPDAPSPAQVAAARNLITGDLLGDFPFTGDAERATAVALLVLPFVRDLIDGPTPLHVLDAPTPGTGKTLLVDALVLPSTGRPATVTTISPNEEETRKKLTSKLIAAPSHIVLDNVKHRLEGGALEGLLTAGYWSDRVLGLSRDVVLSVRCVMVATGNNMQVSGETARRTLSCRLDAGVEHPEERTGFRHPNLLAWERDNRTEIVAAALTLARAWHLAGRPYSGPTHGRFENWAHVVGGILEVAELPGFLTNRRTFSARADEQGTRWRQFVEEWWERHRGEPVETRDLVGFGDDLLDLGADDKSRSLGNLLRDGHDRVVGNLRVEKAGRSGGYTRWKLREVTP
jgi:hypothetical protein